MVNELAKSARGSGGQIRGEPRLCWHRALLRRALAAGCAGELVSGSGQLCQPLCVPVRQSLSQSESTSNSPDGRLGRATRLRACWQRTRLQYRIASTGSWRSARCRVRSLPGRSTIPLIEICSAENSTPQHETKGEMPNPRPLFAGQGLRPNATPTDLAPRHMSDQRRNARTSRQVLCRRGKTVHQFVR